MKKIYFAIALLLFCFSKTEAQTYYPMLDSLNEWSYAVQLIGVRINPNAQSAACTYPLNGYGGSFKEFTTGDTLIDSVSYKIVMNSYWNCTVGYIREDTAARKVYFMNNQGSPEELLYDFSMLPGDTITLSFWNGGGYQSGLYTLDSISTISIYAGTRTIFYLQNHNAPWSAGMTWIESVGCPTEIFYPYFDNSMMGSVFSSCSGIQHQFTQFVCCYNHSGKIYDDSCAYQVALATSSAGSTVLDSCDYYNFQGGLNELSFPGSVSVYPNPVSTNASFSISLSQPQNMELQICDVTGKNLQTLHPGRLPEGTSKLDLDLSFLSDGFYLVMLKSEAGTICTKIQVQH